MTPLMQTKILRVLQDQTFERVGGTETIRTNARIIAATNRNLEQAILDKEFRSDLYYRLNVYTIKLPALREREADIALLAHHFLRRFARELGKEIDGFAAEAIALMNQYRWPGNVRELQSAVKHALLQATGRLSYPPICPKRCGRSGLLVQKRPTSVRPARRFTGPSEHRQANDGPIG